MKRRLMVAKALVHDPDLVVLDEPTAGVDIELRWSLWEYVRELHSRGKTIILTTHYLEEAEMMCDRIAIMDKGSLLAADTVSELKKRFGSAQKKVHFVLEQQLPKQSPFPISTADGRHEVCLTESEVPQLFHWLHEQKLEPKDIEIHSESLDQVFHKVIQHDQ